MIILPSAYLAPVGFYALMLAHGREVRTEQWEHYVKQTVRIKLKKGMNSIRLGEQDSWAPNIDCIELSAI